MKTALRKCMAAFLLTAVSAASLSGCGNNNTQETANSFSYWMELPGAAAAVVTNYGETPFAKELQERTGTTIEFQHPPQGQATERFNIMIASKNLPDIIAYNWTQYPGGPSQAIKDGKIIRLNEYIDQYAPELAAFLEENEDIAKLCKTDEGDIFGFPFIRGTDALCVTEGLVVRKDWLDELNLEEPETMDDWETMLTAFKEAKNIDAPLDMQTYPFQIGAFAGAYGLKMDYYVDEGQIKYGPYEPAFKDFLTEMNDWYNKGLITPDIASIENSAIESDMLTGKTGAVFASIGGGIGKYLTGKQEESYDVAGVKYPVLNDGELPKFHAQQLACPGTFVAITTSCKDIEGAAKLLSYGYTEEGSMFYNFGIEGESYEMIDGYPTYTENITNNSEGFAMSNMLAQYCQSYWQGPFIQKQEYYEQYAGLPQQQDAWKKFAVGDGENRTVPYLYFDEAESQELARKQSAITTYVDEQICKYIMGIEPMDNYDSFVTELENLGIQEVLSAKQNAYAKYQSR